LATSEKPPHDTSDDTFGSGGPRPPRLYLSVARAIERIIRDNRCKIGARIPAERDLSKKLRVSRPSVREAIIALEVAGVVEVRLGSGVYVMMEGPDVALTLANFLAGDPGPGPYEMLEARRLVEAETAFRAASKATRAQIDEIAETVAVMRNDGGSVAFRGDAADRSFHALIAQASGNSVLLAIVRDLSNARGFPMWRRWVERTRTQKMHLLRVAEHERVVRCLQKRDAEGARRAMRQHIDSIAKRFSTV
jgi:GntR family transcriptional regulator, uxu operon transcriptional repressor